MKCAGSVFSKIYRLADLPDEPVPGIPLVEIMGDKRILVECHTGVVAYSGENIQVSVSYGRLSIQGDQLQMRQMTKERLIISGRIDSVELLRR